MDHQQRRLLSLPDSGSGLAFAAVFFAFSLFPSLLPRTGLFQGVVSGVTVAIGYGLGALLAAGWDFLRIPPLRGRVRTITVWTVRVLIAFVLVSAIWQYVGWQNDVRSIMGMDSIDPLRWPIVIVVTLVLAAVLVLVGRLVRRLFVVLSTWLDRILPTIDVEGADFEEEPVEERTPALVG